MTDPPEDPVVLPCFRYGFGVGGEYPMASTSAAERSATTLELRHLRAQQVILVFSNQVRGTVDIPAFVLHHHPPLAH